MDVAERQVPEPTTIEHRSVIACKSDQTRNLALGRHRKKGRLLLTDWAMKSSAAVAYAMARLERLTGAWMISRSRKSGSHSLCLRSEPQRAWSVEPVPAENGRPRK